MIKGGGQHWKVNNSESIGNWLIEGWGRVSKRGIKVSSEGGPFLERTSPRP